MGNDYIARKQRRKESKRNRDDEAPKRIRKKKQPRRICRGECYKSPTLDLDSSDEDMIATVKAHRVQNVTENDKDVLEEETPVEVSKQQGTTTKKKKKKMSTSSQLIMPKAAGSARTAGDRAGEKAAGSRSPTENAEWEASSLSMEFSSQQTMT